jgi:hypothetical protein
MEPSLLFNQDVDYRSTPFVSNKHNNLEDNSNRYTIEKGNYSPFPPSSPLFNEIGDIDPPPDESAHNINSYNKILLDNKLKGDKRKQRAKPCPQSNSNLLYLRFPSLVREWHPTKNSDLNLYKITVGTKKKVWWKCNYIDCAQEWIATVNSRCNGRGCPYCKGKLVPYKNSLSYLYPTLCLEWHPTKNIKSPEDYTSKSSVRIWWKCKNSDCRYEWRTKIRDRVNGSGCHKCKKRKEK